MGAAAGIPIIGGLMSAAGSINEGNSRALDLEDEAATQERNATISRQAAKYNSDRQQMGAEQKIGGVKADYAASGITSDSGSVLDILRESHVNAELDRLNIMHGGEIRAINAENRASNAREGARNIRSASTMNAFSAIFSGAARGASYASGGSNRSSSDVDTTSSGSSYGEAGGGGSDNVYA